jgi:phosphohistidine phosphatase SixA
MWYNDKMRAKFTIRAILILILCAAGRAIAAEPPKADPDKLWTALKEGGHVVILRHSITVAGMVDAAVVKIDDCTTQRALSDAGKALAKRIGEDFHKHEIPIEKVLASQYCRTRETARLAFGEFTDETDINHLSADRERAKAQTAAFRKLASTHPEKGNLILVTHSTNIIALLGFIPDMGEAVVLEQDEEKGFKVMGKLAAGR